MVYSYDAEFQMRSGNFSKLGENTPCCRKIEKSGKRKTIWTDIMDEYQTDGTIQKICQMQIE